MKYIIFIAVLLVVCFAHALEPDKRQHLETSAFISLMTYTVLRANNTRADSYLGAVLVTLSLGMAKELLHDKHPDGADMKYNALGAISAPLVMITFE